MTLTSSIVEGLTLSYSSENRWIHQRLSRGIFTENDLLKYSLRWLNEDSVVLDVGSNIGEFTCFWAKHVARVIAFEASPASAELTGLNALQNALTNVEVVNTFVGTKSGDEVRFGSTKQHGTHGMSHAHPRGAFVVETLALDDYEVDRCDLLKVDVEGHEPDVLAGATRFVDRHRPLMLIECEDRWLTKRSGSSEKKLEQAIRDMGYDTVRLKNNVFGRPRTE